MDLIEKLLSFMNNREKCEQSRHDSNKRNSLQFHSVRRRLRLSTAIV